MKHIILFRSLRGDHWVYKNTAHLSPEKHALEPRGGSLRMAERGRRKSKGREAGLESQSLDTQAKEQCLSIASLLKTRQRKYWRFMDNKQLRHDSVSPARQGKKNEKARLSGVSNLFKFEISAKTSPVLDRCSPKRKGVGENQGETRERD